MYEIEIFQLLLIVVTYNHKYYSVVLNINRINYVSKLQSRIYIYLRVLCIINYSVPKVHLICM